MQIPSSIEPWMTNHDHRCVSANRNENPKPVARFMHKQDANTERTITMMGSWWFLWVAFMFVFLVPPLGYGWGYRGWGTPYPRYIQRRRSAAGDSTINHQAWGFGGDFVWLVMIIGLMWAFSFLLWR